MNPDLLKTLFNQYISSLVFNTPYYYLDLSHPDTVKRSIKSFEILEISRTKENCNITIKFQNEKLSTIRVTYNDIDFGKISSGYLVENYNIFNKAKIFGGIYRDFETAETFFVRNNKKYINNKKNLIRAKIMRCQKELILLDNEFQKYNTMNPKGLLGNENG